MARLLFGRTEQDLRQGEFPAVPSVVVPTRLVLRQSA
jgi:hypothetical protein